MKKLLSIAIILFGLNYTFGQVSYVGKSDTVTYDQAEIKPEYLGGYKEFIKFISENYKTPEVEGLSGIVKVGFVIEVNGRVSNIKIIQDIGGGAAEEAVRVMKNCPIWSPGEVEGERVRVKMELPITIRN